MLSTESFFLASEFASIYSRMQKRGSVWRYGSKHFPDSILLQWIRKACRWSEEILGVWV